MKTDYILVRSIPEVMAFQSAWRTLQPDQPAVLPSEKNVQALINHLLRHLQPPDRHRLVDVGETSVPPVQHGAADMVIDECYFFLFAVACYPMVLIGVAARTMKSGTAGMDACRPLPGAYR